MAVIALKAAETLHQRIVEVFLAHPDEEMYERVLDIVCEVEEFEFIRPDGTHGWLLARGEAVQCGATGRRSFHRHRPASRRVSPAGAWIYEVN
jgi:hypothetical protein